MSMESKRCPDCDTERPVAEFPKNKSTKDGYAAYCKTHHNARTRANRELHGGPRNYHLRRRYGITAADMDFMVTQQDGKCLICGRRFAENLGPVVDHDHSTGAIRGILCDPCNRGLGQFGDSPDRLQAALRYLEK